MSGCEDVWCPECDKLFTVSPDWIVDGLKPSEEVEDDCPHCGAVVLIQYEVTAQWYARPTQPDEEADRDG